MSLMSKRKIVSSITLFAFLMAFRIGVSPSSGSTSSSMRSSGLLFFRAPLYRGALVGIEIHDFRRQGVGLHVERQLYFVRELLRRRLAQLELHAAAAEERLHL